MTRSPYITMAMLIFLALITACSTPQPNRQTSAPTLTSSATQNNDMVNPQNVVTRGLNVGKMTKATVDVPRSYATVRTFFGTNRNVTGTGQDIHFGSTNSANSYGYLDVSIPPNHEVGVIERPSIFKMELKEDPDKHITILMTKLLSKDSYFAEMQQQIAKTKGKKAFIFIHGFNVSFDEAARRTAQMAYDMNFDGVPVFYSWPSNAQLFKYQSDREMAEQSKVKLEEFLRIFFATSNADQVYLISHSMGGEVLTGALVPIIKDDPNIKTKLKEIILAAPDINSEVFKKDIAPVITSIKKPITLYVSNGDSALKISKELNGSNRLGLPSKEGVFIYSGIDTVDMTTIDTSLIGHSYYGEKLPVIQDLKEILNFDRRPPQRSLLKEILLKGKDFFWQYKGSEIVK
jgi:esterase/lipase superfamily enzyme